MHPPAAILSRLSAPFACPSASLQGDFGLTMSMKQESAISPVGTVEYMAPEVGGCACA